MNSILIQLQLHSQLTEEEIKEIFVGCGEIKSIKYINIEKSIVQIEFASEESAEAIQYIYSCYKKKEKGDTTSEDPDISSEDKRIIGDQLYKIIDSIGGYKEDEIVFIINTLFEKHSFDELNDLIEKDEYERTEYIQLIFRQMLNLSAENIDPETKYQD